MSIIHRLTCFACKQEGFVLVNHRVIASTSACLFTTRPPFQRGQSDANVVLVSFQRSPLAFADRKMQSDIFRCHHYSR